MKTIKIEKLSLKNFKGIKELSVPFSKETTILGDNATGKTTVFDAFTWLLFGKDSEDKTDFNIKTLDENNVAIPQIEHEVIGLITIDGHKFELKRIYKEKWTKRRGEETTEMTGHETLYYCNDIPLSQKDYKAKVDSFISEDIFKLITNPLYFNSLKWEDRRKFLVNMAGAIHDDIIEGGKFKDLLKSINGTDIKQYKLSLSTKRKKLQEDIKLIPSRVDEVSKNINDKTDYSDAEKDLKFTKENIVRIEKIISDETTQYNKANSTINEFRTQQLELLRKMSELEQKTKQEAISSNNDLDNEIAATKTSISKIERQIKDCDLHIEDLMRDIKHKEMLLETLRKDFRETDAKQLTFEENQFCCPACKRPLDNIEDKKEDMTKAFNLDKANKLADINKSGKAAKEEIEKIQVKIELVKVNKGELERSLKDVKTTLTALENMPKMEAVDYRTLPEYAELKKQFDALEGKITEAPKLDISKYQKEKADLQMQQEQILKLLSGKENSEKAKLRIAELKEEEKKLAQQIADLEKTEFEIEAFEKAKMTLVEERINEKFKLVKFKMFDQQINGGETPTCITLVNGVPYPDVNTAGKIQAGIDIINVLSRYNQVSAPVIIDNRESITELPETDAQVINLFKDENYKVLTIK
jgi:DNA repair protein SbcC/Rad50